jgi:hypothetical protein
MQACGGLTGGIRFHAIVGPGCSNYAIAKALMMVHPAAMDGF